MKAIRLLKRYSPPYPELTGSGYTLIASLGISEPSRSLDLLRFTKVFNFNFLTSCYRVLNFAQPCRCDSISFCRLTVNKYKVASISVTPCFWDKKNPRMS